MNDEKRMDAAQEYLNEIRCPKCKSTEIARCHHEATWAVPECDYKLCYECGHQWGHE